MRSKVALICKSYPAKYRLSKGSFYRGSLAQLLLNLTKIVISGNLLRQNKSCRQTAADFCRTRSNDVFNRLDEFSFIGVVVAKQGRGMPYAPCIFNLTCVYETMFIRTGRDRPHGPR